MLIKTPSTKKFKSIREAAEISRQKNIDMVRHKKLADQDELQNVMARMGKPLSHHVFIERIKKLTGGKLWAEESIAHKYITQKSVWTFYFMRGGQKKTTEACAFDAGFLPEYTIVSKTDEYGLATETLRGWREVLIKLMQQKHLTHKQVMKHFGTPTPTELDRWDQRNQRLKLEAI